MNVKQGSGNFLAAMPLALLALGGCSGADAGGLPAFMAPIAAARAAPSIEESADPNLIREAHSDGGYWYWQK